MKIKKIKKNAMKQISRIAGVGETVAEYGSNVIEAADRLIHRRAYEEAERKRKIKRIVLWSCVGAAAALLVPYKVSIKPNGEYEIRTLLVNVSRKNRVVGAEENLNETDDGFDIEGVEEVEAIEVEDDAEVIDA